MVGSAVGIYSTSASPAIGLIFNASTTADVTADAATKAVSEWRGTSNFAFSTSSATKPTLASSGITFAASCPKMTMSTTPAINLHEEVTVYVVFSLTSSSAYSHLFSQNDDTNGGGYFRVYADFPSTQNMVWQIDSGINMLSIKSANGKRLVQSSFCASLIGSLASPSIADTVLHSAEIEQMQKCSLESGCCLVVDSSRDL